MPRGVPSITQPKTATQEPPKGEVLGTIKENSTLTSPPTPAYFGGLTFTEPPPPWEQEDREHAPSDARRFVEVPENWELRWINPRLLEQSGWRYWQPVMASDKRVKVKVKMMVSPENNIRRGGNTGDILGWMPKSWVESRRKEQQKLTASLTESAVERQAQLREEFRRGDYGAVSLEEARHPTHTMGEGRSMQD